MAEVAERPLAVPRESAAAPPLPSVAVVIPAYRAEEHILNVLRGIPEFVEHIVVVDDGTPDDTARLVRKFEDPRVHLVSHEKNLGVGAAMLTGYEAALALGAEIVVKMDSDEQMNPAYLLPLITPIVLGQADYTKGNRFLHARELTAMPWPRRLANGAASFATKLASGYWNIFDPTNGYTAVHASVLRLLDRERIAWDFFYEPSMLVELAMSRAVVEDVYMPASYGGQFSSVSLRREALNFPPRLLSSLIRRIWLLYFLRDFTVVTVYLLFGLLLTTFGGAWAIWHWAQELQVPVPASTGTVMLAVLPIIVGLQLLIQALALDIQNVPTQAIHNSLSRRLLEA